MSNITRIFVEGEGDVKFISDYILHIKPNLNAVKITEKQYDIYNAGNLIAAIQVAGGWTKIKDLKPNFTKYKDNNDKILLIFDADTNDNDGGYDRRKKEIEDYALPLDETFLFPSNKDDGALEDLLENIIPQANKPIFDCWEKFEICLRKCETETTREKLTIPTQKSKIYAYITFLLDKTNKEKDKAKDQNRDYSNTEHWNLDSDYLEPLKSFLNKYL